MINLKKIKGKYSKNSYSERNYFLDPPTTSIQDIIGIRNNDTSSDILYPSFRYKSIRHLENGSEGGTIFKGIDNFNNIIIIKKIPKRSAWRSELRVLK